MLSALAACHLLAAIAGTGSTQTPDAARGERAARASDELRVGDRVVLHVPGLTGANDTVTVRAGGVLELPQVPPISVAGVSRVDLQHHLRRQLAVFVRDTSLVSARGLVRIGAIGEVANPGYYAVAPDALVDDVLMRAGGLTRAADAQKITIRRGGGDLWSGSQLRDAIVGGATLDDLRLRPGDEIIVGERRNWAEFARNTALFAGVIVSLLIGTHAVR
ncbi:MAG: hypothetical protein NVS4B3_05020 [Gemmatimonadaceae bacterium]